MGVGGGRGEANGAKVEDTEWNSHVSSLSLLCVLRRRPTSSRFVTLVYTVFVVVSVIAFGPHNYFLLASCGGEYEGSGGRRRDAATAAPAPLCRRRLLFGAGVVYN